MAKKQSTYATSQRLSQRSYSKTFIIATEGGTEVQYFEILRGIGGKLKDRVNKIELVKLKSKSAPYYVLKRLNEHWQKEDRKPQDEAWLVVDKDDWTDNQLQELDNWQKKNPNHGLAVSNPKFEFWLLLHFENGNKISSSKNCSKRLQNHLPNYNKNNKNDKRIYAREITASRIDDAIKRAKNRDRPPCKKWPQTTGTTIYKLVDKMI